MSVLAAPRALVFDLDGTLIDSAADLADAVNEGRGTLGKDETGDVAAEGEEAEAMAEAEAEVS